MLVEDAIIVELKSVDVVSRTGFFLRLNDKRLGLLINFNVEQMAPTELSIALATPTAWTSTRATEISLPLNLFGLGVFAPLRKGEQ